MESQCDYFMYFPAVPFAARELLSGEPGRYRSLPRRNHLYLGETVRFLLVLRCRPGSTGPGRPPWPELAASLAALASVSPGGTGSGGAAAAAEEEEEEEAAGGEDGTGSGGGGGGSAGAGGFRECRALLTHGQGPPGRPAAGVPVEEAIVCRDEAIFPLTIALDGLPPGTARAKIVVTVWNRDAAPPELRAGPGGGYLPLLQARAPPQLFRQERGAFKAQVSTLLTVLPPPAVRCRQLSVSGKHLTLLKVRNASSQEEISLWDVRVLPNFNAAYLPVMPDGSVLLVDDVCHHSGEVPVGAFCRVAAAAAPRPCALGALEEHAFLFQLQAPDSPPEATKEGLEVPLVAVVRWSTPKLPFTTSISTHYRLPSIRLERPRFVMTAACESPVAARRPFVVTYTLLNQLQDFLAVRLVWTPENGPAGRRAAGGGGGGGALDAVVCRSPLTNLGCSRKGSARSVRVAFQALRAGLFELSQHMKLKLQFTASLGPPPPPPEGRPLSRRGSPGAPPPPPVRDLAGLGLGRSQSFSHQQPARGHLIRSGSVMERRAITPPVASPVGRPPLALPPPPAPDRPLLSLDKIAKRECKVLVLEPRA